jgi:hypothetical protein
MPEDKNLSIILGRPFLYTAEDVINCTEDKVTFNLRGMSTPSIFLRRIPRDYGKSVPPLK